MEQENEDTRSGPDANFGWINSQLCSVLAMTCTGHALQTVKNFKRDRFTWDQSLAPSYQRCCTEEPNTQVPAEKA